MNEWCFYSDVRPATEGVYRWRVPSARVSGLIVTFLAYMRERGAGLESMLSPAFDHWDGYRVNIPAGTEWQDVDPQPTMRRCDYEDIQVNAAEISCCPFCQAVPKLRANESDHYGTTIGAPPHHWNNWHLKCCLWISSPRWNDPRELVNRWNQLLAATPEEPQ